MRVITFDTPAQCDVEAGRRVAQQIQQNGSSVIGFATGQTTRGLFRQLVTLHEREALDFSRVTTFNVDEYVGVAPDDPASIHSRMEESFYRHVNLKRENAYIPDGLAPSPEDECEQYETLLGEAGGMDLLVLSIGRNGHLGFNEPGTPFESCTRVARISDESRQIRTDYFGDLDHVPTSGLTMGIRTLTNAREILLMVKGGRKAPILSLSLCGPVTPEIPASVLQLHPRLVVIADRAATR